MALVIISTKIEREFAVRALLESKGKILQEAKHEVQVGQRISDVRPS